MTPKEAIKIVLDYVSEWHFEDRGYDYNECPSCGWNTRKDMEPGGGLDHHEGCKLKKAIDLLNEFAEEL